VINTILRFTYCGGRRGSAQRQRNHMCTSRRSVSADIKHLCRPSGVIGQRRRESGSWLALHYLGVPLGPGFVVVGAPILRLRPAVPFGVPRPMLEE